MSKVVIDKDLGKKLDQAEIDIAIEAALEMDCPNCGKKGLTVKKRQIYCPNCKEFIPLEIRRR